MTSRQPRLATSDQHRGAMEKLWTPLRMSYVGGPKAEGCIFCDKPAAGDDRANSILHRGGPVPCAVPGILGTLTLPTCH